MTFYFHSRRTSSSRKVSTNSHRLSTLYDIYQIPTKFPIQFLFSVLQINTRDEFENFRTGKIGAGYDTIIFEASSHDNVLSQPKYFWSMSFHMIFRGVSGEITMNAKEQSVVAAFSSSTGPLFGLPVVYKDYNVELHGKASIDGSDVFSIASWTQANRIAIDDGNDLTHRLLQKIDELKPLNQLKHLQLNVHHRTYKTVDVKKFLDALTALESMTFGTKRPGSELNEAELKEFVQNQTIADNWEHAINENGVVYKIKHKRTWYQKVVDFFKKIFGWK